MTNSKNILVCPLDWGLGHATRIVPIIDLLIESKAKVFLAADHRPLAYLKKRFPECEFVVFPGYSPKYPVKGSMALSMIKSYPKMVSEARKARKHLNKIIRGKNIDIVISDNRYELNSEDIYSVFITHQLNIQTPGILNLGAPFVKWIIDKYIRKFNELWIPDVGNSPNLSGILSHVAKIPNENFHFIGPLSRFSLVKNSPNFEKPDLLIILSGPEPQRTILEEMLISQVAETDLKTIILQGKPEDETERSIDNIRIIPHLPDEKIASLIKNAGLIICRPGYSTIMDLAVLEKKAIFIPTPGQTEQQYLAKKLMDEGYCYSHKQKDFDLKNALELQSRYKGITFSHDHQLLKERIESLLEDVEINNDQTGNS